MRHNSIKWESRAACADLDTAYQQLNEDAQRRGQEGVARAELTSDIFFPVSYNKMNANKPNTKLQLALRVCNLCEVRAECLEYAMQQHDTRDHGVYGGTVPQQRRDIARQNGTLIPRKRAKSKKAI